MCVDVPSPPNQVDRSKIATLAGELGLPAQHVMEALRSAANPNMDMGTTRTAYLSANDIESRMLMNLGPTNQHTPRRLWSGLQRLARLSMRGSKTGRQASLGDEGFLEDGDPLEEDPDASRRSLFRQP